MDMDVIGGIALIIGLLLFALCCGNFATCEPLLHRPGSRPGAGFRSWWRKEDR
jgi:hypothetical protein